MIILVQVFVFDQDNEHGRRLAQMMSFDLLVEEQLGNFCSGKDGECLKINTQ